ncbi:TIGR04219 family outer membrane beta-barrel protein [Psychromonas sp.]|uniref:TIGR04219 family outer membrane beta-barrel protein n=1 Tax=Psychromonas sp. TaxID=1884585 RepID=UPI00356B3C2D
MKKQISATIIASAMCMPATAMVDVYAGLDYRTTDTSQSVSGEDLKETNNLSGYLAFEHFIPMLPNAKLKYSDLSSETEAGSTKIDSSASNAILYYQLFNNDLFEVDLGLAYTHLDSDFQNLSSDLAQAYAAAKFFVPATGINAFAEIISGSLNSDKANDIELGVAYTFNPDAIINIAVRAGYRFQDAEINNLDQENKGLFAGMEIHF